MWPKLFMQIVDLLPKLGVLVPTVERLLIGGGAAASVEGITELREDVGQMGEEHAGLLRQIHNQSVQIAAVEDKVEQLRTSLDNTENRLLQVESALVQMLRWVKIGIYMIALLFVLAVVMVIHLLMMH